MVTHASFSHAIVRRPSSTFAAGITTAALGAPDYKLMLTQHAAYVARLQELGINVIELAALQNHPDAHFVEDTAVLVPEVAVIANMGAAARQGEEQAMIPIL